MEDAPAAVASKANRSRKGMVIQMTPNTWAMLCHLSGLIGYLGNGLGSVVGPLAIWIVKKDEMPEVDRHGKEALNFNISVAIYGLILGTVTFATLGIGMLLTIPLLFALAIFHFVCVITAAVKANNGEDYQYPMCMRIVK
jgi:uncharacterized Tic20 family protein